MTHAPYKLAVLTYLPGIENTFRSFSFSNEYTLTYFTIQYNKHDMGVKELLESGYEVVLMYSSFSQGIMEEFGNSLVSVAKTDLDVIRALLKAAPKDQLIGIPVHNQEYVDVRLLEKLCNVRLRKIEYNSMDTLERGIFEAFDEGMEGLVGGGYTAGMATQIGGITYYPVVPNHHSFKAAIEQAKGIAKGKRQEQIKHEQMVAIFKLFEEGVLYIDDERHCVYSNRMAKRLLGISCMNPEEEFASYYENLMLTDVLQNGIPVEEHVVTIGRKQLVVKTLPVSISSGKGGAVSFFRDVASLQDFAGRIRTAQKQLHGFVAQYSVENMIGESAAMQRLKNMITTYGPHDSSVLIHGETGTGKDLAAQSLHNASPRREGPFVAINCAAIPDSLLESELFGYEEGAFTGAKKGGKPGVFEMAHTGTLFLDEIGDLGHNAQLRLLRVLENKEVIRVGGSQVIPVNIRIISASHKSLPQLVREGGFRADLFYRLAVLRLNMPPLRNRMDDIELLLKPLLEYYGHGSDSLTPAILKAMHAYTWPGNVRELRSIMESYLILLGKKKQDEALFHTIFAEWTSAESSIFPQPSACQILSDGSLKDMVDEARKNFVEQTVSRCGGNKRQAAKQLEISYNTLWRILGSEEEKTDIAFSHDSLEPNEGK